MTVGSVVNCPCCCNAQCCEVRLDKHQRPYCVCLVCGSRLFLRTQQALRGLTFLWGPLTRAVVAGDKAAAVAMVEAEAAKAAAEQGVLLNGQPTAVSH